MLSRGKLKEAIEQVAAFVIAIAIIVVVAFPLWFWLWFREQTEGMSRGQRVGLLIAWLVIAFLVYLELTGQKPKWMNILDDYECLKWQHIHPHSICL
jgi:small-conductance mechanosensitive channel